MDRKLDEKVRSCAQSGGESFLLTALKTITRTVVSTEWFSRLWVVQETVGLAYFTAKELDLSPAAIICTDSYQWDAGGFCSLILVAMSMSTSDPARAQALTLESDQYFDALQPALLHLVSTRHVLSRAYIRETPSRALIDGLLLYSNRRCSDPRDRVYALRSLYGSDNVDDLYPDYSLDFRVLCQRFTRWYLVDQKTGSEPIVWHPMLLLAMIPTTSSVFNSVEMPSWVLNINALTPNSNDKRYLYQEERTASPWCHQFSQPYLTAVWEHMIASCHFKSPLRESKLLSSKGNIFAVAHRRLELPSSPLTMPSGSPSETKPLTKKQLTFAAWYCSAREIIRSYAIRSGGIELEMEMTVFLSYPLCHIVEDIEDEVSDHFSSLKTSQKEALLSATGVPHSEELSARLQWLAHRLDGRFTSLTSDRALWEIKSENRMSVAWLPEAAAIGDETCAFAGSPWPFLLRSAGDGTHRLIGDCHTHSIPLIEALGGSFNLRLHKKKYWPGHALGWNMDYRDMDSLVAMMDQITLC